MCTTNKAQNISNRYSYRQNRKTTYRKHANVEKNMTIMSELIGMATD